MITCESKEPTIGSIATYLLQNEVTFDDEVKESIVNAAADDASDKSAGDKNDDIHHLFALV